MVKNYKKVTRIHVTNIILSTIYQYSFHLASNQIISVV
nr:MAG TPA: hypothetical protein [Caudoviricetes sp.]